jgi:hypothetical protein
MADDKPLSITAQHIALSLFGWALLLVCGCAATPQPLLKPPDVRLGPVLNVLAMETGSDKVRLVPDALNQIHALVASSRTDRVLHVTVRGNDASKPETVASDLFPGHMDAAFDRAGNLHLLVDAQHFIRTDGVWRKSASTPWSGTGFEPGWAGFVPGAPELVWAFEVKGARVGASMRMDIYGFGGYGAGIIWPWFTRGSRLVLVHEDHPDCWNIVELPGRFDSIPCAFAADPKGGLHVTYTRTLGGLLQSNEPHYASLRLRDLAQDLEPQPTIIRIGNRSVRIRNITGGALPRLSQSVLPSCAPLAADPQSGTVLVGTNLLVRDRMYAELPWGSLAEEGIGPRHTAAAGGDAFHAMRGGCYSLFDGAAWSAPLELGVPEVADFWGTALDAVDLTGTTDGRAFAAWPVRHGIAGRWIERDSPGTAAPPLLDGPMWPLPDPARPEPFAPVHVIMSTSTRDQGLERLSRVLVTDSRNATDLRRTTILDTTISSISLHPPVPALVKTMVENQADRLLAGQAGTMPEAIGCDLAAFDIRTPATMISWDVEARLAWSLRIRGKTRMVEACATERTYLWPSEEIITRVVGKALRQAEEETRQALRDLLETETH